MSTKQCVMSGWTSSSEQLWIFIRYTMPHHFIFQKYSVAMWLYFLWCGKRFIVDEKNILPHGQGSGFKTQIISFWRYLFINMVVQKLYPYTLEIISKIKLINPSKDNKNITYSINDIHCTMKLIFPTSSLEVFH